ncbi:MAG: glucosyl-3-phosphoglycerate synthase [Actinomycetota bacterium]
MDPFGDSQVSEWFRTRTLVPDPRTIAELAALKSARGVTVSVCLPALNEAATIGQICGVVVKDLIRGGLVDELVVVDSGSSDDTPAIARSAGAEVFHARDLVPQAPPTRAPGKGETLWKSLSVVSGDIVVWADSDTRNFDPRFVTRLVAPLLDHDSIGFVKAFYERPLRTETVTLPAEGARVTEIAVRPLLNLFFPRLAGVIQPLSGEYAGKVELLRDLPFLTGYAVDVGLLIDIVERHGLQVLAQADLGKRIHRNRDVPALGRMSFEIMHALLRRLDDEARLKLSEPLRDHLVQFTDGATGPEAARFDAAIEERRPMNDYL